VAADQVPAHLIAEPERALQVDARATPPMSSGGQAQRFRRRIHGEERPITSGAALDNGKANSGTGDRSPDRDRIGIVVAGDDEPAQVIGFFIDLKNFAQSRDDAAKHGPTRVRILPGDQDRPARWTLG